VPHNIVVDPRTLRHALALHTNHLPERRDDLDHVAAHFDLLRRRREGAFLGRGGLASP
jgi:hypothetical protein